MPTSHGGKITIFVTSGSSFDVSVSAPEGLPAEFTHAGEPVTFPVTITESAEFDTDIDGEYILSIKQDGVECATNAGTQARPYLHFNSLFSVTPSTVKAEPVVPANFVEPVVEAPVVVAPEPPAEPDASQETTDGPTLV